MLTARAPTHLGIMSSASASGVNGYRPLEMSANLLKHRYQAGIYRVELTIPALAPKLYSAEMGAYVAGHNIHLK